LGAAAGISFSLVEKREGHERSESSTSTGDDVALSSNFLEFCARYEATSFYSAGTWLPFLVRLRREIELAIALSWKAMSRLVYGKRMQKAL
jgi:hypothetical protein